MMPFKIKIKRNIHKVFSVVAICLLPLMANTAYAVELHQNPTVEDTVIRLSDIFTDTGAAGNEIIMHAPDPGKRKQISGYTLTVMAKKYELDWEKPAYIKRIHVQRSGEAFSLADLKPAIQNMIAENGIQSDIEITMFGKKSGLFLPLGYSVGDITYKNFTLNDRKSRFTATAEIPSGAEAPSELKISGTLEEVRLVPALNRILSPGEIITKTDITWKKYPLRRINSNIITSSKNMIGLTVRRALTPGQLLRTTDISMPVMISKGSQVTMTYKSGALLLTTRGRALDNGGKGDVIRVMNAKSMQTLDAKITSPGNVAVASSAIQQLASR